MTSTIRAAPGAYHPMVLRHPETGIDALYLGRRQDAYVEGLPLAESEAFLDAVWRHVALEGDTWTQDWEVGDVVVVGQPQRHAPARRVRSRRPAPDAPRPGEG